VHVFKTVLLSSITPSQTLVTASPLTISARAANPAGTARTRANTHAGFPAPRSATVPGIPRTPRPRQPIRLAITAVPKITPTPEIGKPRKTLLPNFPSNFPIFPKLFPISFPFFSYFFLFSFLPFFPFFSFFSLSFLFLPFFLSFPSLLSLSFPLLPPAAGPAWHR
jgi:hypothetical protein